MKAEVIFNRFVKTDLEEINLWYRKIDLKLWQSSLKEYRLKINLIRENPLSLEIKYDLTRIIFFKKFPYGIHYQFIVDKNQIQIIAVLHTSRDSDILRTENKKITQNFE